jgi:hypothetical protein
MGGAKRYPSLLEMVGFASLYPPYGPCRPNREEEQNAVGLRTLSLLPFGFPCRVQPSRRSGPGASTQCSEQQATELPSVPPLPPVRTLRVRPRSPDDSLNADAGGPPAPTTSGVVPGNDPKAIRIMPIKPDRVDGDAASGAARCAISS